MKMGKKSCVYVNGLFVPEDKAVISVFDRGLNYGDGLFETIRAEHGRPVFVRAHMERLAHGAERLGLPKKPLLDLKKEVRQGLVERLLEANSLGTGPARVKILVTRGADRGGHLPKRRTRPNIMASARALDNALIERHRKRGVNAILLESPLPAMPGVKSLNFLPNVLARVEAEKRGAFEALFVDARRGLREGASTNLFLVTRGVVKTPRAGEYALAGVARSVALALAKEMRIPAREVRLRTKELYSCDEAFLTNSVIGITPLLRVDGRAIGRARPGPITRLLQGRFAEVSGPGEDGAELAF